MSTGTFDSWGGNMLEIGPLYPFVGSEMLLVIVGVVFWVGWHIWQARMESANYADDMATLKKDDNMAKALRGEKVLRSM
jgi:hypothetical protein